MAFKIDGKYAEGVACDLLEKRGYKILERNFRTKLGELDIVALDGDTLAFVEVKARTSRKFGLPEEAVSPSKLRKIRNTAGVFLKSKKLEKSKTKIEVYALEFKGRVLDQARLILVD